MRALVPWLIVAAIWISAGGVVAGFLMPWVTLKTNREVVGAVDSVMEATPFAGLVKDVSKRVGHVVIHVKRGTDTITAELPDLSTLPSTIRGADIPVLANRDDVKGAAALAELLTGQRTWGRVGVNSYAIYLVPGLALVFALTVTFVHRPWVGGLIGATCVAIAGIWWWKLATVKLETAMVAVLLEPGLWLSCGSYAGLGAASLARALTLRAPPRD